MIKKLLYFVLLCMAIVSCTRNVKNDSEPIDHLDVSAIINSDIDYMSQHYDSYYWIETCILLDHAANSGKCDGVAVMMTNVFQVQQGNGGDDILLVTYTHTLDSSYIEKKKCLWFDGMSLSLSDIPITFEEAFDHMMQSGRTLPHSRQVLLRKDPGMIHNDAQYVFGNSLYRLYVNAISGYVSDFNPSFETTPHRYTDITE